MWMFLVSTRSPDTSGDTCPVTADDLTWTERGHPMAGWRICRDHLSPWQEAEKAFGILLVGLEILQQL